MAQAARAARHGQEEAFEPSPQQPARRTVTIHGRPDGMPPARHLSVVPSLRPTSALGARTARVVQVERRRPRRRSSQRLGAQPDRLAMWAVLMALFLIAVTLLSAH